MSDTVEAVKAVVNAPKPDTGFDWEQFQKPAMRDEIDKARREFLARGPRKMLVRNKKTKALEWIEVTGAITRIDGSGPNQKKTLCRFHRPRVGAQPQWTPGCVPRPDLMQK